jgi:hypothetical protein
MFRILRTIAGPRVPQDELQRHAARYRIPGFLLMFARLALIVSLFLPYWKMDLHAPQYPEGLHVSAYIDHLVGDVHEIDTLNHYIGMRKLEEAAQLERTLSIAMLIALIFLVEGAVHVHSPWAALLILPTIVFPPFFLADLWYWLHTFGQNLDPSAPLSKAIKPFTPPILGVGVIGQFKTVAYAGPGLWLAAGASVISLAALYFHRRAYRPLARAARERRTAAPALAA